MAFDATFNNISAISCWWVLLVKETRETGENHRPVASRWQTLWHNVLSSTPRHAKSIKLKIKRTVSLEWLIVLGGGGNLRTVIKVSVYICVGCLMHNIGLCILFCQPYFFHSMTSPLHYLSFEFSIHGNWIPTKRKYKPHLSIVNTTFSYHVSRFITQTRL